MRSGLVPDTGRPLNFSSVFSSDTFKSSRLEGSGPGFLTGAGVFCLGVLGVVLFRAEFPLLFLSLSGLWKKVKVY